MYELNHIGISGCKLHLINKHTLRKVSPSSDYNQRLNMQMDKQAKFISIDGVVVPRVMDSGYERDLFYFDMDYINGKLFNQEFQRISKETLDKYIDILIRYLNTIESTTIGVYAEDDVKFAILNKLSSLLPKTTYPKLIEFVVNKVQISKLSKLPKTICHGDLTLSNILFNDNKLCFVDFLDSYIDSYIIDIIKLRQDLYYGWYSQLLPIEESYKTRINQVFQYMWDAIQLEYSDVINTELFEILDVLNFLRIEPYIHTIEQKQVLHKVIGDTTLYEKFNSTYGGKVHQIS